MAAKRSAATGEQRIQAAFRDQLVDRIRQIDPEAVIEVSAGRIRANDWFSDWHDRFRDNGSFTDGFGKSGGLPLKARVIGSARPARATTATRKRR